MCASIVPDSSSGAHVLRMLLASIRERTSRGRAIERV
jgi:hypothetical protein